MNIIILGVYNDENPRDDDSYVINGQKLLIMD